MIQVVPVESGEWNAFRILKFIFTVDTKVDSEAFWAD